MIVISLKNMIYYKQEKKSHQRVVALDSSQISKTDVPNVLRSAKPLCVRRFHYLFI